MSNLSSSVIQPPPQLLPKSDVEKSSGLCGIKDDIKRYKMFSQKSFLFYNSSLVLLLISNLTNEFRLHQFLGTTTIEANSMQTELISKITNEKKD